MELVPADHTGIASLVIGPENGRLLLCLHGFPDVPDTWVPVGERLASNGFRVVAPYLPGYAPSSLQGPFDARSLAARLAPYIRTVGRGAPVDLIGHDWGAVLAYALAHWHPRLVGKLVSLAVPHPGAFAGNLLRNPRQLLRSSYMAFFQLGKVAERGVELRNYALLRRLWRTWSPGYDPSDPYFSKLTHCLSQSWPAPLMYYRAYGRDGLARKHMHQLAQSPIAAPTLYLHGRQDGCIGVGLIAAHERHFTGPFEQRIVDDAGHFLQLERPGEIASAALSWLRR